MKALSVVYGGRLAPEAFEKMPGTGQSPFSLALAAAGRFAGAEKTVLLCLDGQNHDLPPGVQAVRRPSWTIKSLLEEIARLGAGFDLVYFAWADCPLLDPELAGALAQRHIRYAAEYSYADGWPYGFAPELLAPGTAGILSSILTGDGPVQRDSLFGVIQKDINAFDLETEISPVDLRHYRLSLAADSKRNSLLLSRFMEAGFTSASQAETCIRERPELLRTLPAFFNIQISAVCTQACSLCPWPIYGAKGDTPVTGRQEFMRKDAFAVLLEKIEEFAGDAVISVSLWGEPALHPEKMELIELVLARPALSLLIETSGIGWKNDELQALAAAASGAAPRKNHQPPLSWIVSLDAYSPERYREIRGPGFAEARACAKTLFELFPRDTYVQALRVSGFEDDIENFYRSWKGEDLPRQALEAGRKDGEHIIIQKYDDFAGALPKLQASDLSPVKRRPCWHIQRDMNILLDGTVPCCREDVGAIRGAGDKPVWGNARTGELGAIWENGAAVYREHCDLQYKGICAGCDEYYTYNF
ncbi:MAG: spiro-SPASM protein [Treponema sp.]|nr:spiro-SPASM protein [Treponema sp.]